MNSLGSTTRSMLRPPNSEAVTMVWKFQPSKVCLNEVPLKPVAAKTERVKPKRTAKRRPPQPSRSKPSLKNRAPAKKSKK